MAVPSLRFRGFEDDWAENKVKNLFDIKAGGDISKEHVSELKTTKFRYPIYANSEKKFGLFGYSDLYKVDYDSITVSGRGSLGQAKARLEKYYPIVRLLILKTKKDQNLIFFEYVFNNLNIYNESTGVPQLTGPQFGTYQVFYPTLPEQRKIADFLSAVDEKIRLLTEKKYKLETYKKGVMQKLFPKAGQTNPELRFKRSDGSAFPDWDNKTLSHYLYETKLRNKDAEYTKDDVLSVSGESGIVNQIDFMGRSYAGESVLNYHVVRPRDIVYTKSPLKRNPYGIVKVNKGRAGIVSTLYAVYGCKDNVIGQYLDYYFGLDDNTNRYLRPLVRKGAKNDMKINNAHVLSDPLPVPCLQEQRRIVEFLDVITLRIRREKEEVDQMKNFKKGLLQQMFV